MDSPLRNSKAIYRGEGLVFNLICGVYFLFISPHVVTVIQSGMSGAKEAAFSPVWLGIALVAVSLLEIRALPEKLKFVHFAINEHEDKSGRGFLLWLFHAVISILVLFHAAQAFGVDVFAEGSESEIPGWLTALIPIVVLKELYFLFVIRGINDKPAAENYSRPNPKEWQHDLVLTIYACLAYSTAWGMMADTDLDRENTVMFVINIIVSGLLFLMFYLPLRIPFHLEEMAQIKRPRDAFLLIASILAALIPAIYSLP